MFLETGRMACSAFGTPRSCAACIRNCPQSLGFLAQTGMAGQRMTEHSLQLVRSTENTPRAARHPLGELDADRVAKHLVLFRPPAETVEDLVGRARARIPGMTDMSVINAVLDHNPDCLGAIARRRKYNQDEPVGEGFVAMLPLTAAGLRQLGGGSVEHSHAALRL